MELPTKVVIFRSSGASYRINVADFDPALHAEPGVAHAAPAGQAPAVADLSDEAEPQDAPEPAQAKQQARRRGGR